jgi:hypothetical protein
MFAIFRMMKNPITIMMLLAIGMQTHGHSNSSPM